MSWAAFGMGALERLTGNLSDTYGTGKQLRSDKREENLNDYREMERTGIMSRVEGAKAAGLHPLAALGYQSGPTPTTVIGADPIQSSPGAFRRDPPEDPDIKRYNRARADLAELEVLDAQRKSRETLARQPGQTSVVLSTSSENLTNGIYKPGVKVKPDETVATRKNDSSRTAAVHPGGTDVELPGIGTVTIPSEKASQGLEDLELLKYIAILQANKQSIGAAIHNFVVNSTGLDPIYGGRRKDADEIERLKKRYPPKGKPAKYPPRMHGGDVK